MNTEIFGILSSSNNKYVRGEKFMLYSKIFSLQKYKTINSEIVRIDTFRRNAVHRRNPGDYFSL